MSIHNEKKQTHTHTQRVLNGVGMSLFRSLFSCVFVHFDDVAFYSKHHHKLRMKCVFLTHSLTLFFSFRAQSYSRDDILYISANECTRQTEIISHSHQSLIEKEKLLLTSESKRGIKWMEMNMSMYKYTVVYFIVRMLWTLFLLRMYCCPHTHIHTHSFGGALVK